MRMSQIKFALFRALGKTTQETAQFLVQWDAAADVSEQERVRRQFFGEYMKFVGYVLADKKTVVDRQGNPLNANVEPGDLAVLVEDMGYWICEVYPPAI
jgi:hypothetical protein